jgi:hypothetical protein
MSMPQHQSGQPEPGTDAALARELESTCGSSDILNARARAVENRDLIRPRPAAAAADDHIPELGVDGLGRHPPGPDGVVQIAHGRALREDVRDHGRPRHQLGMNFALLRIVRANGRDEGARPHIVKPQIGLTRRGACHDDVAFQDKDAAAAAGFVGAWNRGRPAAFRRPHRGAGLRPGWWADPADCGSAGNSSWS